MGVGGGVAARAREGGAHGGIDRDEEEGEGERGGVI